MCEALTRRTKYVVRGREMAVREKRVKEKIRARWRRYGEAVGGQVIGRGVTARTYI